MIRMEMLQRKGTKKDVRVARERSGHSSRDALFILAQVRERCEGQAPVRHLQRERFNSHVPHVLGPKLSWSSGFDSRVPRNECLECDTSPSALILRQHEGHNALKKYCLPAGLRIQFTNVEAMTVRRYINRGAERRQVVGGQRTRSSVA
jgi:hypothetical protein